jgi:hypothetical protein
MASFVRMGEEIPVSPAPVPLQQQNWAQHLETSIERGANHLLSLQAEQGYWQGELEADTTLERLAARATRLPIREGRLARTA